MVEGIEFIFGTLCCIYSNSIFTISDYKQYSWELYISREVVREIRNGNPEAARKRLEAVRDVKFLREPDGVEQLSAHLAAAGAIPKKAKDDAAHIAMATLSGMDYLVAWNQTHIFNPDTLEKLYYTIRGAGHRPSVLVRPDNLLEKKDVL